MNCFQDKTRSCDSSCMAHLVSDDGKAVCALVAVANSFVNMNYLSLLKAMAPPKAKTKFPESAPPPKVIT